MQRIWIFLALGVLVIGGMAACGGDSSSDSGDSGSSSETDDDGGSDDSGGFTMVPLSSLGLDLPYEMTYDPPVPSDATLSDAIVSEATDATHPGVNIFLNTGATYDDVIADYDAYVATLEFGQGFPDSRAWTGRRAEGEPGVSIGFGGGRLNIAEIEDQG